MFHFPEPGQESSRFKSIRAGFSISVEQSQTQQLFKRNFESKEKQNAELKSSFFEIWHFDGVILGGTALTRRSEAACHSLFIINTSHLSPAICTRALERKSAELHRSRPQWKDWLVENENTRTRGENFYVFGKTKIFHFQFSVFFTLLMSQADWHHRERKCAMITWYPELVKGRKIGISRTLFCRIFNKHVDVVVSSKRRKKFPTICETTRMMSKSELNVHEWRGLEW